MNNQLKRWRLDLGDDDVTLLADALYLAIRFLEVEAGLAPDAETTTAYHAQAARLEAFREEQVLPLLDTMYTIRRVSSTGDQE